MASPGRVFASTALSPEWDRWFDEEFTDLISRDEDLVRAEFDALIAGSWHVPPRTPPAASDDATPAGTGGAGGPTGPAAGIVPQEPDGDQRSPPG